MIDPRAIALVELFEGCDLKAYRDPVGIWTIGWGTTAAAGLGIAPAEGMVISQAEADMYLMRGLEKFAAIITPMIINANPSEFGAFLSLAYNIGPDAFKRSTCLRQFNLGNKLAAADAILLWNKSGGKVLPGLVRRREAEKALFLSPPPATDLTLEERVAELERRMDQVSLHLLSK
jgi:lysozyme